LGLEEELDRESRDSEGELEGGDHTGMTVRQAYDELMAYLVDNTANAGGGGGMMMDARGGAAGTTESQDPSFSQKYPSLDCVKNGKKDWVGQSPRAGLAANNDAKLFLAHHDSIRILWQVSFIFFVFTGSYSFTFVVSWGSSSVSWFFPRDWFRVLSFRMRIHFMGGSVFDMRDNELSTPSPHWMMRRTM
jgi:hypothetical protein